MGKIHKFLLMIIAMVAIMIIAVGIDKGMERYSARKWEKERVERYEQAYADVADMEMKISQLAQDQEALEAFIEENKEYFDEASAYDKEEKPSVSEKGEALEVSDNLLESVSGNAEAGVSGSESDTVSGGALTVSENHLASVNEIQDQEVSGNSTENVSGNSVEVSGNSMENVSGNGVEVSGNSVEAVSGNSMEGISGNGFAAVSGNEMISGNEISGGNEGQAAVSGNTLLEKRKIRGSYMETQMQNETDLKVIAKNSFDFSDISIACLGDSITEAANLNSLADYQQYSYPTRLKEILGAESVTNLGIGGSSIGRYWENAFVDRYKEIPADTDLIVVMGGTNDGFCMNQSELGTMEERKARTFIGDLDELMRGLKENYPDATIVFATPLPNVLHDMLRKERDYLLPQTAIANAMKQLAAEYEIPVIDLYNSNILDTHDAAVIYNYMPDGVHCNSEGYALLAEHMAAELIKLYGGVETQTADGEEAETEEAYAADGEEPEAEEAYAADGEELEAEEVNAVKAEAEVQGTEETETGA